MEIGNIPAKIINLDHRRDRWARVILEMAKIGVVDYERFSAIPGGWGGSVHSHLKAVSEGEGMTLIFEDDVWFDPDLLHVLELALNQLPEDFDIFYLGANVKQPSVRYSDNLFRVTCGVHTNHAILFSDNARKIIKKHYEDNLINNRFDFSAYSAKYVTFDHWLFSYGLELMKGYVCSPMVAFQKGGVSDVRGENLDAVYMEEMLKNQNLHMI